ncbi:hypothetical protein TJA_20440 [Thermus sp. LT1-2-5]|uniref:hypothetical protein n=1 Tax=Thermus sp. LT1-2-5 TaxID=3026935 RepID=UPI0030E9EDD1
MGAFGACGLCTKSSPFPSPSPAGVQGDFDLLGKPRWRFSCLPPISPQTQRSLWEEVKRRLPPDVYQDLLTLELLPKLVYVALLYENDDYEVLGFPVLAEDKLNA